MKEGFKTGNSALWSLKSITCECHSSASKRPFQHQKYVGEEGFIDSDGRADYN